MQDKLSSWYINTIFEKQNKIGLSFLKVIIEEAEITNSNKKINGFKNIEIELNKRWWRDKRWNLIVTNGLFKHLRVDDRGY